MVAHAFNPVISQAEASVCLKPAQSTQRVPGHSELHRETYLRKQNKTSIIKKTVLPDGNVIYHFCWKPGMPGSRIL